MTDDRHASLQIHHHAAGSAPVLHKRQIIRRTLWILFVFVVFLALGAGRTLMNRHQQGAALAAVADEQSRINVTVTQAKQGRAGAGLLLPGTLQGKVESPIYARATGYVLRWHKDIGSDVAKGEVLAELDTPEIDQQLSQAIAARDQTTASLALAQSSAQRWEALRRKDAVSQQEVDERNSTYTQAKSNVIAAEANVKRLQQQQAFKRIVAPYAGTITRRNVDIGDLVDAGNGGAARALFTLATIETLKTNVLVPQTNAQSIEVGQQVAIRQAEIPGRTFTGTIARTAGAIDIATRTLQVVVELPNADRRLMPGAYVEVEFKGVSSTNLITPSNTLLFRAEGPRVAVVTDESKVKLAPITIGRNFGRAVEVLSGISAKDRLVVNPPDSLAEGDTVFVTAPVEKEGA